VKKLVIATAAAALFSVFAIPATAQQGSTAQTIANLNMTATPDLDRDGVRAVQRALREKSIDPGPIDGSAGPRTREAVRTFQSRYGMKPTGAIDNQLLFAMGQADLAILSAR
jgi:peptidoglycan hydrolase-like protein with peptidoglycan-binding domain